MSPQPPALPETMHSRAAAAPIVPVFTPWPGLGCAAGDPWFVGAAQSDGAWLPTGKLRAVTALWRESGQSSTLDNVPLDTAMTVQTPLTFGLGPSQRDLGRERRRAGGTPSSPCRARTPGCTGRFSLR